MSPLPLHNYLVVGAVLFALGMVGFLARRNLIVMFLSAEMMLQGVAINLVAFARYRGNLDGQVFVAVHPHRGGVRGGHRPGADPDAVPHASSRSTSACGRTCASRARSRPWTRSRCRRRRREEPLPHLTPAGAEPARPREETSHV